MTPRLPLRRSEWVFAGYFLYVSALAVFSARARTGPGLFAWLVPVALLWVARADRRSTHRRWSHLRDWVSPALILVAYWSVDWVTRPGGDPHFELVLLGWDRLLLNPWGLRAGIERFGAVVPLVLEAAYLLVYVLPVLIILIPCVRHRRDRIDDLVFPLVLGTLTTYALLPHFPSHTPRIAFAGQDLPGIETAIRGMNVWILNHADIESSVFPSRHVGLAFSAAFATFLAVPARRGLGWTLLAIAVLVWITTIYDRYHYAADGLAALAVSGTAIGLLAVRRKLSRPTYGPRNNRGPARRRRQGSIQ